MVDEVATVVGALAALEEVVVATTIITMEEEVEEVEAGITRAEVVAGTTMDLKVAVEAEEAAEGPIQITIKEVAIRVEEVMTVVDPKVATIGVVASGSTTVALIVAFGGVACGTTPVSILTSSHCVLKQFFAPGKIHLTRLYTLLLLYRAKAAAATAVQREPTA